MWSYPWPVGARGLCDSASLPVTRPPPFFCCRYHKILHFLTMAAMRTSLPSLPPFSVSATWRNRHIPTKKWQCPCGKVPPIAQAPHSKAFGIHCSGAQHTDWVRYGKVVPEYFQGSVNSATSLPSMLIRVDKHPQLLGAVRLSSTLPAAGAAAVAKPRPALQVPGPDVDAAMEIDLDDPIPLCERQCPGVLPRQAPTLQQVRRIYPVIRSNYEKPRWECCIRRGVLALHCRTDGR